MGVAERAAIAARLMAGGRSPDTPVAVVERAGTPAQRVRRGRLDELATLDISPPATIVIGPVAALDVVGRAEMTSTESMSRGHEVIATAQR
jgi:siroheme synthase